MVSCDIEFDNEEMKKVYGISDEEIEILSENLRHLKNSVRSQVVSFLILEISNLSELKKLIEIDGETK